MSKNYQAKSNITPPLPEDNHADYRPINGKYNSEIVNNSNNKSKFFNLKTKVIILAIATVGLSGVTFLGASIHTINIAQKESIAMETDSEKIEGYLPTNLAALRSRLLLIIFLSSCGIALLASVFFKILMESQQRSLLQIDGALEQLSQGDLTTRIEVSGHNEFTQLSLKINQTIDKIQAQIQEEHLAAQQQIEEQVAIAEKARQVNESIQQELLQFLMSIEGASNGDLTVRAEITEGEIGIVADFFNSIVENWRDIVTQVQKTTAKVNSSVGENENAIRQVAEEALQQTTQISQTLNAVEIMTNSIQEVAKNAQAAAEVSRTAAVTAETGGEAIEETVTSILQLRETVASTAKKVKRLGESSQEISKVISLIEQIAMQTNLLAINASIEASRAGEEGRGFAVVAEEVGELAAKSAEATQEIEAIIENIQEETQEVVEAMEIGTAQVVEGTRLVENTKQSLDRIVSVSRQIDQLLQSISNATISQAKTSQTVTALMQEVSQVSSRTSHASRQVSNSLEETVKIAQDLETAIGIFQV
jgi:twitching motility protein PilJ